MKPIKFNLNEYLRELDGDEDDNASFWREEPLSLREFAGHPDHLSGIKPTNAQLKPLEEFIGDDLQEFLTVESKKPVLVLKWAKGSGKSLITSVTLLYVFYLLLCVRNLNKALNIPSNEKIHLVNVAQSQTMAREVFFSRVTSRLLSWKWLRDRFDVYDNGTIVGKKKGKMAIDITSMSVRCDNGISLRSLHSASQNSEGLNVFFWVIDEGSAFPTKAYMDEDGVTVYKSAADSIEDVLRTSSTSRRWAWHGFSISYPREPNDYIVRKFEEGLKPDSIYKSHMDYAWNLLPEDKYSKTKVEWNGYYIPEDIVQEANTDPAMFKRSYLLIVDTLSAHFFDPGAYESIIDPELEPSIECELKVKQANQLYESSKDTYAQTRKNKYAHEYIVMELKKLKPPGDFDYVLTADFSLDLCRTCICIAHGEEQNNVRVVVVDGLLIIQPFKKYNQLISHDYLHKTIIKIVDTYPVAYASIDQMESARILEILESRGLEVERHNVNMEDYTSFRFMQRNGCIKCIECPPLKGEIENIIKINEKKVDHAPGSYKDILDTLVAATRLVETHDISMLKTPEGEPIRSAYDEEEGVPEFPDQHEQMQLPPFYFHIPWGKG